MKRTIKALSSAIILSVAIISCHKSQPKPTSPTTASSEVSKAYDFRADKKLIEACNAKSENATTAAKEYSGVDMNVINAIYAITLGSNRIAAFSLLSANEKYAYWDNLISIKTENQGFTQAQKDLVSSFRTLIITPTLYSNSTNGDNARTALEGALANIVEQFYINGITTSQLLNTLESSNLGNSNNIPYSTVNGGNLPECTCNRGSIVNTLKMQQCGDVCAIRGSGCGLASAFSCNGRPYTIGPNNSKDFLDTP